MQTSSALTSRPTSRAVRVKELRIRRRTPSSPVSLGTRDHRVRELYAGVMIGLSNRLQGPCDETTRSVHCRTQELARHGTQAQEMLETSRCTASPRTQKENPAPNAEDICVFGYPEFGTSPNLEKFVEQLRLENSGLVVGNNRPFSARTPALRVPRDNHRMACPVTFPNVVQRGNVFNHFTIEVCQDLIKTADDQRTMARRLSSAVAAVPAARVL
jgi:hypothetical protein